MSTSSTRQRAAAAATAERAAAAAREARIAEAEAAARRAAETARAATVAAEAAAEAAVALRAEVDGDVEGGDDRHDGRNHRRRVSPSPQPRRGRRGRRDSPIVQRVIKESGGSTPWPMLTKTNYND